MLTVLLLSLSACLAWFMSTLVAGGAASLLLPLLVWVLGSQQAAPCIAVAAIVSNPTRAFVFAKFINWRVIAFLLPGTCLGAIIGAYGFTQLNSQHIKLLIGIFLVSTLFQERLEKAGFRLIKQAAWFLPLGAMVAFISAVVGALGPVYNPFLLSYGLEKESLIATKAFNSFVMQAIKIIAYGSFGAMNENILGYGFILGISGAIGVLFAKRFLVSMSTQSFKRLMYIFMPLIGCLFIYQSLTSI